MIEEHYDKELDQKSSRIKKDESGPEGRDKQIRGGGRHQCSIRLSHHGHLKVKSRVTVWTALRAEESDTAVLPVNQATKTK